ncbi:hypothetical protein LQ764DRAFT_233204 [Zygosaccharomyces rouxii]|nr:hypothetical protein LQ764DRAFT_233204 [Zygosaccharomyces rouxii]
MFSVNIGGFLYFFYLEFLYLSDTVYNDLIVYHGTSAAKTWILGGYFLSHFHFRFFLKVFMRDDSSMKLSHEEVSSLPFRLFLIA